MLRLKTSFLIVGLSLFTCVALEHADSLSPADTYPVYLAKIPNPNNYNLFANGGWDGNWYVGYNTCWIKQLPPIPSGTYERAFIGAKLGRMKLLNNSKNVWDKKPIPGQVYMAISSTTTWSKNQSHLLTPTETIPLEGDSESAVEGTGESEWFWTEIPLEQLNVSGPNYLALWSPTPALINVSSSPVLAAAWGGKEEDTWLLRDIQGAPPRTPVALGPPLSYFQPAMALKLIPHGPEHPIRVQIAEWKNATAEYAKPTLIAHVDGDSIQNAWMEYSMGGKTWTPITRPLWKAPYIFSFDQSKLPPGRVQLRVVATNIWEDRASSLPFAVDVSYPRPTK